MHASVQSPAQGLTQSFLKIAQGRGFAIPEEGSGTREYFEAEFAHRIDDFIELAELSLPPEHIKDQFALGLRTRSLPRAVPPECKELDIVRSSEPVVGYPVDHLVTQEVLDRLTICFSCFFRREGMQGMHYIEILNLLRNFVAEGIEMFDASYVVREELLEETRERSNWAKYDEWACLARANGEYFMNILTAVQLARKHAA